MIFEGIKMILVQEVGSANHYAKSKIIKFQQTKLIFSLSTKM